MVCRSVEAWPIPSKVYFNLAPFASRAVARIQLVGP
jgi:hypothetical protein